MSEQLRLHRRAMQEVDQACGLISARFPKVATKANAVRKLARDGSPLSGVHFDNLLKNIQPYELDEMDEGARTLLGRVNNWLAGARWFPLSGDEGDVARGAEVRAFREEHSLSQSRLAKLLPTAKRNIENWEQGEGFPPEYLTRALRDLKRELREQE